MFGQDRSQLRRMFFNTWRKHQSGENLEPLEQLIAEVIQLHPEYHVMLEDEHANLDRDYTPDMGQTNPFLHMAMHISIREQLATQRPIGIVSLYQQLLAKFTHVHDVEHQMMECLGHMLWRAQREGQAPDENHYLDCLNKLI